MLKLTRSLKRELDEPVLVWEEEGKPIYWRSINPIKAKKGFLVPSEPRFVKGKNRNLYVVEGFTDYLALYQIDPYGNFLILGTVNNAEKSLKLLKKLEDKYRIFIALDNDEAGRKATEKILSQVKGIDLADFYKGYKDVMDWWQEEGFRNFVKIKSVVEEQPSYINQEKPRGFGLGL